MLILAILSEEQQLSFSSLPITFLVFDAFWTSDTVLLSKELSDAFVTSFEFVCLLDRVSLCDFLSTYSMFCKIRWFKLSSETCSLLFSFFSNDELDFTDLIQSSFATDNPVTSIIVRSLALFDASSCSFRPLSCRTVVISGEFFFSSVFVTSPVNDSEEIDVFLSKLATERFVKPIALSP